MATVPTTSVSREFKREVKQLIDEWKPIKKGYADLAKQHLEFAKLMLELWNKAKALDRGTKQTVHKDYMRQLLQKAVQTDDASILTRWRIIGEHADSLLPVSEYLPVHRDHLYELARAVKQDKPVSQWIEMERIHPGVSVRDINALNREGVPRKSTAKVTRTRSVTFNFSSNLEASEIVAILRSAFSTNKFESIITDTSVIDECKASLKDIFDKLEPKFKDSSPTKVNQAVSKRRKISNK